MGSEAKRVSVERTISAPADKIFDVLADPNQHAVIDGSGTGNILLRASDTDQKATKTKLATSLFTRLAYVDAGARAWVMVRGSFTAKRKPGGVASSHLE